MVLRSTNYPTVNPRPLLNSLASLSFPLRRLLLTLVSHRWLSVFQQMRCIGILQGMLPLWSISSLRFMVLLFLVMLRSMLLILVVLMCPVLFLLCMFWMLLHPWRTKWSPVASYMCWVHHGGCGRGPVNLFEFLVLYKIMYYWVIFYYIFEDTLVHFWRICLL